MASLSDWTSGQSKNLKKESQTPDNSLPNHLLHSNFDVQMDQNLKKNHLRAIFWFLTPFLVMNTNLPRPGSNPNKL